MKITKFIRIDFYTIYCKGQVKGKDKHDFNKHVLIVCGVREPTVEINSLHSGCVGTCNSSVAGNSRAMLSVARPLPVSRTLRPIFLELKDVQVVVLRT